MKKRINLNYLYLLLLISNYNLYADSFKILFIGNSFTHMNNFPMMFKELAATSGDTLEVDYSAVDSYTLEKHSKYSETLEKNSLWLLGLCCFAGTKVSDPQQIVILFIINFILCKLYRLNN